MSGCPATERATTMNNNNNPQIATLSSDQGVFQVQIVVTPLKKPPFSCLSKGATSGAAASIAKLPSIYNYKDKQWITKKSTTAESLATSRYHRNCRQNSLEAVDKQQLRKLRSLRSPTGRYDVNSRLSTSNMDQITESSVKEYLQSHPDFLENYLLRHVDPMVLSRCSRKSRQEQVQERRSSVPAGVLKWHLANPMDKRQMLDNLINTLQHEPNKDNVLWEISNCITSVIDADQFRLYRPDPNDEDCYICKMPICEDEVNVIKFKSSQIPLVAKVAASHECVRDYINYLQYDKDGNVIEEEYSSVLVFPVIDKIDERLVAIIELVRSQSIYPYHFETRDEEIALNFIVWGGVALHYSHCNTQIDQQKKLNVYLLDVVKSIFQDMGSIDKLVKKIMNYTQELVNADRASLFLVDTDNKELYSRIFDVGSVTTEETQEFRFPLGKGIAGEVAMTGKILNIPDAYSDSRFNSSVDQITGYKTRSILCMPIFQSKGQVIGVVQMVNKKVGNFNKEDEDAFEIFAVYCGLALHHATLYDTIVTSEQQYRVALEVLSYHRSCSDNEFLEAINEGIPEEIIGIDSYYMNSFGMDDYEKVRNAIFMFNDLFGLIDFDKNCLLRFGLTVKKNYRRVPYHNWTHGFSVAHCMYVILKKSNDVFTVNERLALYIGALCHDLDHRGKNNKFMLDSESPLAGIYSTSTMEHHHFNQTVTILQQDGHNIFSKLPSQQYKEILDLLRHCILATDLAKFFPNKTLLAKLVNEEAFSWINSDHRLLIQALTMTGCDLSASAKPWDIQVQTVDIIFEEFYQQGDEERAAGRTPLPMMDRTLPDQRPTSQVGFLMGICEPCYSLLYTLIPETKELLVMCEKNLEGWQEIEAQTKQKY